MTGVRDETKKKTRMKLSLCGLFRAYIFFEEEGISAF